MNTELTIGRLANEAGVNVETIRYYQRRGLMPQPEKPVGGHRSYGASVRRVRFIKRAQVLRRSLASPWKKSGLCSSLMRPAPALGHANWVRTSWR
jgi:hypothetical protein